MSTSLAIASSSATSNVSISTIESKFDQLLKEVPSNHFYKAEAMKKLLQKYNSEELKLVYLDLLELREHTFHKAAKNRDYLVTAGGPSAGKSTILENYLAEEASDQKRVYTDPDRTCLLHMKQTYLADLQKGLGPQLAYEKWREASNFLANYYLAYALKEGYAIAHGSTMATPFAKNALTSIHHAYGYKTTIMHVTCDEETRKLSEKKRRESGVIQCTDADFQEKQALFFTLLPDYIHSVDSIHFYCRASMEAAVLAAKVENGKLMIMDESSFQCIREAHIKGSSEKVWDDAFSKLQK